MTEDSESDADAPASASGPAPEADAEESASSTTEADAPASEAATETDPAEEVRAALAAVRRECRKAAFVYASLDAVCVLLAVSLAVEAVGPPVSNADVAAAAFDALGLPAPGAGTLAGLLAGLVAFAAEFAVRTRRPAAERFEAANPEVREALRTARDAVESDRSNPMARALYADVLDRLRDASSVGLLNATRLAATVALALALSLATVQTAVVGVELVGSGPNAGAGGSGAPGDESALPDDETADLRSGDEVLGDPTNVSAGSQNLSAAVSASPGGEGQRDWNYEGEAGGSESEGDVEARRAGFASPDRVEDAALVQRYVRELQGNTTDD